MTGRQGALRAIIIMMMVLCYTGKTRPKARNDNGRDQTGNQVRYPGG